MNNHILLDAISCLDKELLAEHLEIKSKLRAKAKIKRIFTKWAISVACLTIVLVSISLTTNELARKNFGEIGEYKISMSEVVYKGQRIEANESRNYLKQHETEILSWISKNSHVEVASLHLSYNGIYHVTATEKSNFINYNIITFFVVDTNGTIVSSLDLFRDGESFNYQVNGGSVSIDKLNEVISQYPNTNFAMIYIEDFTEAIIAPDNSVYFLNGEKSVIEDVDYYSLFNKEINLISDTLLK